MRATLDRLPESVTNLRGEQGSEDAGRGLRRWMVAGDRFQILRYEFPEGAACAPHQHPEEQALVVTRGRILFQVEDREYVLGEGDTIVVPPAVTHSSRVLSEGTAEALVVLSRSDGIDGQLGRT